MLEIHKPTLAPDIHEQFKKPYYVDVIRLIHSRDSVYIDLGFSMEDRKIIYLYRSASTPNVFKILSNLLQEKVAEFEEMVTSIDLPKEPQKDIDQEHLKGKIEIKEKYKRPEFINVIRVGYRYDIFSMDVGYLKESVTDIGQANYTKRFVFSPHTAKVFSKTIRENLVMYEQKHGEIII